MNEHGVSRSLSKADVKYMKSGALRTSTNVIRNLIN